MHTHVAHMVEVLYAYPCAPVRRRLPRHIKRLSCVRLRAPRALPLATAQVEVNAESGSVAFKAKAKFNHLVGDVRAASDAVIGSRRVELF
eukprot:364599-Chlamydomonas_euryale.AAC.14